MTPLPRRSRAASAVSLFASSLLSLLSLGLGACHPEAPVATHTGINNNGMEEQGRYLLGEEIDGWAGSVTGEHFSISTRATTTSGQVVTLTIPQGAQLKTSPAVPIQKLLLTGGPAGKPVTLRITEVARVPADPTITQLLVEKQYEDGRWGPVPCGNNLAVPLAGVFTRAGLHEQVQGRLTLACLRDGVAAKCTEWAFRAGPNPDTDVWRTHQACTRMARADICGTGRSHTRNSTRIWFYDTIEDNGIPDAVDSQLVEPLTQWPPPPDRYYFEAMWRPGDDHAGCLSKLRWQALMPGALCNGLLPDPRGPGGSGLAGYCEGASVEDAIETGGALMFNRTQYSDLALSLWAADRTNGRDFTTTVRGFRGGPADPTIHPFWEHAGNSYQPIRHEAFLLRVPPSNLMPQQYAPVATFRNTVSNDRVLARRDDPLIGASGNYVVEFDEGFVTTEPLDGSRTALYMWHHPVSKDLVATTGLNGPTPGHVRMHLIGYVADPDPFLQ